MRTSGRGFARASRPAAPTGGPPPTAAASSASGCSPEPRSSSGGPTRAPGPRCDSRCHTAGGSPAPLGGCAARARGRLAVPHGWRLAVAIGVVLAAIGLLVLQLWSVARLPVERRIAARPKMANVAFMLPHTRQEERWFVALSLTAGACEELLFRGYLPWVFAPWLGSVGALAAVAVAFGASHSYQGRTGAIRATIAGFAMAAIAWISGSLTPRVGARALIDIGGGTIGYWLLREQKVVNAPLPA